MAQPGRAFAASSESQGRFALLVLAGELDYGTVTAVSHRLEALIDAGSTAVVVDLSEVTLLTSSAINVFFDAVRRLRLVGGGLALVCSDPALQNVLRVTALDQAAEVRASQDTARAALVARGTLT